MIRAGMGCPAYLKNDIDLMHSVINTVTQLLHVIVSEHSKRNNLIMVIAYAISCDDCD